MANPFTGLFDEAAKQHGLEPDWLSTFARIESGFNPNVRTGSYKGLFQLSDDEFGKHGGQGNIFDPRANTFAAAAKLRRERDEFSAKYGRQPTAAEIYFIHQQGVAGAPAHWNNPSQPAWQSMLSTPEGQRRGPGWARQAIWGNVPNDVKAKYGSVDNLPSGEFWKLWQDKVARFGGQSAPSSPQPPDGMDAATHGTKSPLMALGGPKPGSTPMTTYDGMTPEEVELNRRMGMRNAQLGSDASPVGHWLQGLARMAQGGLGGYQLHQAKTGESSGQAAATQSLAAALQGGDPKSAIASMAGNPWTRDLAGKLAGNALQGELEAQSQMGKLKHEMLGYERDLKKRELETPKFDSVTIPEGGLHIIKDRAGNVVKTLSGNPKEREDALTKKIANETAEIAVKYIQAGDAAGDMMGAVNELKAISKAPGLDGAIGQWVGNPLYQSTLGRVPMAPGNPELNAKINRLQQTLSLGGTQAFLKGLGSASDAEGRRVEEAVSNLSKSRNRAEFENNLRIIETGLHRQLARSQAARQRFPQLDVAGYGRPSAQGAAPGTAPPNVPAGTPADAAPRAPQPGKRDFSALPRSDQRTALTRLAKDASPETLANFEMEFGTAALEQAMQSVEKLRKGTAF